MATRDKKEFLIKLPHSSNKEIKLLKDLGISLLDSIVDQEIKQYQPSPEIIENYKKRLKSYFSIVLKNTKDNIEFTREVPELKAKIIEYTERNESLSFENDKLISNLHKIIEQYRMKKHLITDKLHKKVESNFVPCRKLIEDQSSEKLIIVCMDNEKNVKEIPWDKFLSSYVGSYLGSLKNGLECHKTSLANSEVLYQIRKDELVETVKQEEDLQKNLNKSFFDLSPEENVLFE